MDRQVFTILVEPIRTEFEFSDTQMGFLGGFAFALFHTLAGIPIARWADIGVRKNIVAVAIGLWSLMTALTAATRGFFSLLVFRIGVGIGEAGCTPPIHSLISDLFPERQRASALSIYAAGLPLGIAAGTLLGGWVGEYYGWRTAFLVCGVPGVLVAGLVYLTIQEPRRGLSESSEVPAGQEPPLFRLVMRHLWGMKSYVHLSIGVAIISAGLAGMMLFLPSFFLRVHGFSLSEISTYLFASSLTSTAGIYLGGVLVDRYGMQDRRWYLWIPCLGIVLAVPFLMFLFAVNHPIAAALLIFPVQFLHALILAPVFSAIQMLAPPRMRAVASACYLVVVNLIGMGLGPLAAGMLSDWLRADFGEASIRFALLLLVLGSSIWAVLHLYIASRTVRADKLSSELCVR